MPEKTSHRFEIVTDSTCDLPLDLLASLDVTVVPLTVFFGADSFLDQVDISSEEFYDKMEASETLPHSSQPSPDVFAKTYEDLAEKGVEHILSMHLAGALSGTVNSARLAGDAVSKKVEVSSYDTRAVAMTFGMMVREAVGMRDSGATVEETIAHLEKVRAHLQLLVVPDTLENLVKNGRCTRAAGAATSLLDIKVQLSMDDAGNLVPAHKAKGTKRALRYVVRAIEERQPLKSKLVVAFLTSRNAEGCETLRTMIEDEGYELEVQGLYNAGPVVATHGGIGIIGLGVMPASVSCLS